jgi:hypothetical protein
MRVEVYNPETDRYDVQRLFVCYKCYEQMLDNGEAEDRTPTLTLQDFGYPCNCGTTTDG